MDILEMKEEAAWREAESRRDELIKKWNAKFPVGSAVRGCSYKFVNKPEHLEDIEFDGLTTSKAYFDGTTGTTAVVDVEGHKRVSLHRTFESIGWDGSRHW
jgi:hypothetical protein